MKKRMIAALMATALAVSALAGCSSKPAESAAAPAETKKNIVLYYQILSKSGS